MAISESQLYEAVAVAYGEDIVSDSSEYYDRYLPAFGLISNWSTLVAINSSDELNPPPSVEMYVRKGLRSGFKFASNLLQQVEVSDG